MKDATGSREWHIGANCLEFQNLNSQCNCDRNCLRVEVPLHMRCHLVKKGGSISDFDGGRSLGTETGARAFSARR